MSVRPISGRAAAIYGVLLFCAAAALSQVGPVRTWLHSTGPLHAWYHVALFAALGALAVRVSMRPLPRLGWLAAAMLVGLAMEYGECFRDGYPLEWVDVWTDCGGVLLGGAVGWLLTRRAGKP